jgi:hypothetical protein
MNAKPAWGSGILSEQEWLTYIEAVHANPRVAAAWYAHKHGITFEEALERGGHRPADAEAHGDVLAALPT